jgi:hypothetical protein
MMKNKISLAFTFCLVLLSQCLFASDIAYIVGDTAIIGGDTIFVQRIESRLGYDVHLFDDDAVDTFSNWGGNFIGIVISDLAYSTKMSALRDTAVGIFTMDRYTDNEFGLAATNCRPGGHGRRLVNNRNSDFFCAPEADTIFPYQYDNQYLYYYGDLAEGAVVPFNTPDFVTHDTACVILLDEDSLTIDSDSAAARRAFCGLFRNPEIMDYCHSWRLFDRLVAWVCEDTANSGIMEYECWGGHLDIDACWCEMTTAQNDSSTYNTEFRFGFDLDDIISFWRLTNPQRKVREGYSCDSLLLMFPIFALGINGTPPDTIMDVRYTAYRIIRYEKWHGPPPNSGGDPYELDSTWVTRWDCVSGSSPVPWDTLDLRAGIDYDVLALDTFRLNYPEDSIGDTVRFMIPGLVFDTWADTSDNNGLVLKVTAVYDSLSNVEYSAHAPIENALSNGMRVQAWFSPVEESETEYVPDVIGAGILEKPGREIIR